VIQTDEVKPGDWLLGWGESGEDVEVASVSRRKLGLIQIQVVGGSAYVEQYLRTNRAITVMREG
jgi:hypothetical protein